MASYKQPTITIEFPDESADPSDPIKVTIRNPQVLPFGMAEKMQLAGDGGGVKESYPVLAELIRSWNVPDIDSGETLPIPTEDNLDPLTRCPLFVMNGIFQRMNAENQETVDPNSQES